jgi:hypothetical protein
MGGGYDTYEVRSERDTLWLIGKSTNIRYRIGDELGRPWSLNPRSWSYIAL